MIRVVPGPMFSGADNPFGQSKTKVCPTGQGHRQLDNLNIHSRVVCVSSVQEAKPVQRNQSCGSSVSHFSLISRNLPIVTIPSLRFLISPYQGIYQQMTFLRSIFAISRQLSSLFLLALLFRFLIVSRDLQQCDPFVPFSGSFIKILPPLRLAKLFFAISSLCGCTVGQCGLGNLTNGKIDHVRPSFHIAVCWEAILNGINHTPPAGEANSAWH
jgi:hypothetical protein